MSNVWADTFSHENEVSAVSLVCPMFVHAQYVWLTRCNGFSGDSLKMFGRGLGSSAMPENRE